MGNGAESSFIGSVIIQDFLAGIHIDRRTGAGGEIGQGEVFTVEVVVGIGEQIMSMTRASCFFPSGCFVAPAVLPPVLWALEPVQNASGRRIKLAIGMVPGIQQSGEAFHQLHLIERRGQRGRGGMRLYAATDHRLTRAEHIENRKRRPQAG